MTRAVTEGGPGLGLDTRTERGHLIAALRGELDITTAPALREQLLGLLRPAASRLVIDLSAVRYADASGLAVLVGTARRARRLGGFLRLAAPAPAAAEVLRLTGIGRQLATFRTVQAAMPGPRVASTGLTAQRELPLAQAVSAGTHPASRPRGNPRLPAGHPAPGVLPIHGPARPLPSPGRLQCRSSWLPGSGGGTRRGR